MRGVTTQQARNLAMALGERPEEMRFLVRDRGAQFTAHYNAARPHQGIAQPVPDPDQPTVNVIDLETARIRRTRVLGGLAGEYQNSAWNSRKSTGQTPEWHF
jgi:hypothetical protein